MISIINKPLADDKFARGLFVIIFPDVYQDYGLQKWPP